MAPSTLTSTPVSTLQIAQSLGRQPRPTCQPSSTLAHPPPPWATPVVRLGGLWYALAPLGTLGRRHGTLGNPHDHRINIALVRLGVRFGTFPSPPPVHKYPRLYPPHSCQLVKFVGNPRNLFAHIILSSAGRKAKIEPQKSPVFAGLLSLFNKILQNDLTDWTLTKPNVYAGPNAS